MQVPQPGENLGHYRIDRVIGQGGMGVVYAATDLRLAREVALKVITGPLAATEEFRRRFHHEALAMSRVQSPWIVQIHDHDEVDGFPYIVTQFVHGEDLGSLVADEGRLSARRALQLCAQLARGLDDAHRAGVLHRDVKPGNVLVAGAGTGREHAYLCDFGIAVSDAASHHTQTGMVAGTWAYLAPERTLGRPAVPASDLYAVGCVLWTCLTGSEPFVGSQVEVAIAHANAPVPQLPDDDGFTQQLNRLLQRALAKDPDLRHPDGATLAAELEQLARVAPDGPVRAPAPGAGAAIAAVTAARPGAPRASSSPSPPYAGGGPVGAAPVPAGAHGRRVRGAVAVAVLVALLAGGATWAGLSLGGDDVPDRDPGKESAAPEPVTGDLDGDGRGDVLAASRVESGPVTGTGAALWKLESTGTAFGPATPAARETGAPLLGDVDADGRTDQVWFVDPGAVPGELSTGYRVRVLAGSGEIWEHSRTFDAATQWDDLLPHLADVDGDGRDDLLVSGSSVEEAGTMVVQAALAGDQSFGEPEPVLDLGASDHPVTGVGDFDGDGDDDLFRATNTYDGAARFVTGVKVEPYVNEEGTFAAGEATELDETTWAVGWFLAGDPDGDGVDDLVVTNGRGGDVARIALVDGTFGQPTTWLDGGISDAEWEAAVRRDAAPYFAHALSDVDGDGDDDLLSARFGGEAGLQVAVALAEDDGFGSWDVWGAIDDCTRDECELITLVSNVQPSIV